MVTKRRKGTVCPPEQDRTRQEFKDDCDINVIVARTERGIYPQVPPDVGQFGDFTQLADLHTSLERVRKADNFFMALKAEVRAAFDNDVTKFGDAFQSAEGIAKLRELGVIPQADDVRLNEREAAAELRAEARAKARAEHERMEAARSLPPVAGSK